MNIYTKTGDEGQTSLVGGKRVSKTDERLEAYGTVDELNAHIGLLIACCRQQASGLSLVDEDLLLLGDIQNQLFVVGSYLATDPTTATPISLSDDDVWHLEKAIDRISDSLPPLRAFILPGGSVAAAQAQVCRTVCRRTERVILRLHQKQEIDKKIRCFMNRLSDYLFVFSRKLNFTVGNEEKKWNNTCK